MILAALCAVLLALPNPFGGGGKSTGPDKDVNAVLAAEAQLTHDAAQFGVRAAFLKWLAAESMMFHPHPESARDVYTALPAAKSGFARYPSRVLVSNGADLALTSGTWTYKADSAQARVDVYGAFVTMWRRGKDGWQIEFDCGLPHFAPRGPAPELDAQVLPRATRGGADSKSTLAQAEVEYAATAGTRGLPVALASQGGDGVTVYRWGSPGIAGSGTAKDSLAGIDDHVTLRPRERFVSGSGDLGYGYGDFIRRRGALADSTHYLHVWRRGSDKDWRLIVDYVEGAPKRAK